MYDKDLLKDKVAIVTGGGSGIGKVLALDLAKHGAHVAVAARKLDRLEEAAAEIRALGRKAEAVPVDISDPGQVEAMADAVEQKLGPVDILINNAAANFVWPSEKLTAVRWKKIIDIVLNGTFYCSLEAGKRMIGRGSGNIVNLIATYAWTGAPGFLPSSCAKGGILAMTRSLGVEWARKGLRVNAIAPGPIDTPQSRERLWPTPEMAKRLTDSVPLGRFGLEEDVSNVVLFLCSPLARNITGECIVTDGGQWLGKGALDLLGSLEIVRKGRGPKAGGVRG